MIHWCAQTPCLAYAAALAACVYCPTQQLHVVFNYMRDVILDRSIGQGRIQGGGGGFGHKSATETLYVNIRQSPENPGRPENLGGPAPSMIYRAEKCDH